MGIGQKIQTIRLQRGLTQGALARATGIAQANLSNIEMGKRDLNVGTLKRICFALQVPAWQIVRETEETAEKVSLTREELEGLAKTILGEGGHRPGSIKSELVKALRRIFSLDRGVSDRKLNQSWLEALGAFSSGQIKTIGERVKDQRLRAS